MQALRLVGIHKSYGDVAAVRGVEATFAAGEVHAVVGENGAGKSTLLKIAAGVVQPDAGEVSIEGKRLSPHTAAEAIKRGVGMVQQHFALVPVFSVLENMVLGAEPANFYGKLDLDKSRARASKVLEELDAQLPLDAQVEDLGVGDRQRLEIARILYRNARILILDEPTAVLTAHEAEALYAMLRRLAASGCAVVVVTHKLDEVVAHAERVTVMRKGEMVEARALERGREHADEEARRLAAAIMGADPPDVPSRASGGLGGPALVCKKVNFGRALVDVDIEVRSGEVVGVAGVEGNGQRELVRVIAGLDRPDSGIVWTRTEPTKSARAGRGGGGGEPPPKVAVVFEDRHAEGLVLDTTVRENFVLGELARFTTMGVVRNGRVEAEARARQDRARVYPPNLDLPARALSGGNQQKIVVGRALARIDQGCAALVLAHPTRGVDLGAARAIHEQILDAATRRRAAVLVISSDLAELRVLCHRLIVMAKGRIVAELPPTATDAEIGEKMLAVAHGAAPSSGALPSAPHSAPSPLPSGRHL